jgi:hypothetical protein
VKGPTELWLGARQESPPDLRDASPASEGPKQVVRRGIQVAGGGLKRQVGGGGGGGTYHSSVHDAGVP